MSTKISNPKSSGSGSTLRLLAADPLMVGGSNNTSTTTAGSSTSNNNHSSSAGSNGNVWNRTTVLGHHLGPMQQGGTPLLSASQDHSAGASSPGPAFPPTASTDSHPLGPATSGAQEQLLGGGGGSSSLQQLPPSSGGDQQQQIGVSGAGSRTLEEGTTTAVQILASDVLHLLTVDVDCEITRIDPKLMMSMPPKSKVVGCNGQAVQSRADLRQLLEAGQSGGTQDYVEIEIFAARRTVVGTTTAGVDSNERSIGDIEADEELDGVVGGAGSSMFGSQKIVPPPREVLDQAIEEQGAGRPILIVSQNRHSPDACLDMMAKEKGSSVMRFDAALSLSKRPSQLEAMGQIQRAIQRGDWLCFVHATKAMSLLNILIKVLSGYKLGTSTSEQQASPMVEKFLEDGSEAPPGVNKPSVAGSQQEEQQQKENTSQPSPKKPDFPAKPKIFIIMEPHPHFPAFLLNNAILLRFFAKDAAIDPLASGKCVLRFANLPDNSEETRFALVRTGNEGNTTLVTAAADSSAMLNEEDQEDEKHMEIKVDSQSTHGASAEKDQRPSSSGVFNSSALAGSKDKTPNSDTKKKKIKRKKKLTFANDVNIVEFEKLPEYVAPATSSGGGNCGQPSAGAGGSKGDSSQTSGGLEESSAHEKHQQKSRRGRVGLVKLSDSEVGIDDLPKSRKPAEETTGTGDSSDAASRIKLLRSENFLQNGEKFTCLSRAGCEGRFAAGTSEGFSCLFDAEARQLLQCRSHSCVTWGLDFRNPHRFVSVSEDHTCMEWAYQPHNGLGRGFASRVLSRSSGDVLCAKYLSDSVIVSGGMSGVLTWHRYSEIDDTPKRPLGEFYRTYFSSKHKNYNNSTFDGGMVKTQIPTVSTVRCLATSPGRDPALIASGGGSGAVTVYDAVTQKQIWLVTKHLNRVTCLTWGDNNTLISGSSDCSLAITDPRSGELIARYKTSNGEACNALATQGYDVAVCSGEALSIFDVRKQSNPPASPRSRSEGGGIGFSSPEFSDAFSNSDNNGNSLRTVTANTPTTTPSWAVFQAEARDRNRSSSVPYGTLVQVGDIHMDYHYLLNQQREELQFVAQPSDEALLHKKARAWKGKAHGILFMTQREAARCSVGMDVDSKNNGSSSEGTSSRTSSGEKILVTASTDGCVRFHGYV